MPEQQPENLGAALKRVKPRFKTPNIQLKISQPVKILVIFLAVLVAAYNLLFVYVQPNEYGIKVVRIGIESRRPEGGLHRGLHLVDARVAADVPSAAGYPGPGVDRLLRGRRPIRRERTGWPTSRLRTAFSLMWMSPSSTASRIPIWSSPRSVPAACSKTTALFPKRSRRSRRPWAS